MRSLDYCSTIRTILQYSNSSDNGNLVQAQIFYIAHLLMQARSVIGHTTLQNNHKAFELETATKHARICKSLAFKPVCLLAPSAAHGPPWDFNPERRYRFYATLPATVPS